MTSVRVRPSPEQEPGLKRFEKDCHDVQWEFPIRIYCFGGEAWTDPESTLLTCFIHWGLQDQKSCSNKKSNQYLQQIIRPDVLLPTRGPRMQGLQ